MELIQWNASRDEGYHGQAPRGNIGGWNPEGKSSIDLVAQFVGLTAAGQKLVPEVRSR